jgi:hypothetical protein
MCSSARFCRPFASSVRYTIHKSGVWAEDNDNLARFANETELSASSSPKDRLKSLRELYVAHAGKVSDKWSIYLDTYDRVFSELRDKPIRLLEIGVQNGGSLEIWRQYFPHAGLIVGCDINPSCAYLKFDDDKIHVVLGDANSDDTERGICKISDNFDIIIDDGSHKSSDIVGTFARYFNHINNGGLYIVEDIHCSYWQEYGGGLYDPFSSLAFFKRLVDVVNHEHWGVARNREDALSAFADKYRISLSETSIASIHSLEFLNSLCIIKKQPSEQNVLGPRRVAGREAAVVEVASDGTTAKAFDQSNNPWSLQSTTMEEEIVANREAALRLIDEQARAGLLEAELEKVKLHAQEVQNSTNRQLAAQSQQITALGDEIRRARSEFEEIRNSRSWRITAPLRLLRTVGRRPMRHLPDGRVSAVIDRKDEGVQLSETRQAGTAIQAKDWATSETDPAFASLSKLPDPQTPNETEIAKDSSKLIAFYLPQYHRIPENSEWWGPGFTEWTNVAKGKPNFAGHHQPNIPRELGYYDLTNVDIMREQVELARLYGVHGFCFYHYWFSGQRILEKPVENFLKSNIAMNFCLCWANENWTRTWDGDTKSVLMEQKYADGDAEAFIDSLIDSFRDPRYVTIDDKPMLLVYRAKDIPNPKQWFGIWRERVRKHGFSGLHIAAVDFYDISTPDEVGADSLVEFPPHKFNGPQNHPKVSPSISNPNFAGGIIDYVKVIAQSAHRPAPAFKLFRGIMPSWDNTARRQDTPTIVMNARPDLYGAWLSYLRAYARSESPDESNRFIFINAWNEWGEGCYIEPDQRWGLSYLEQTLKSSYYEAAATPGASLSGARDLLFQRVAKILAETNSDGEAARGMLPPLNVSTVSDIAAELTAYSPVSEFARKVSTALLKYPTLRKVAKLGYMAMLRIRR